MKGKKKHACVSQRRRVCQVRDRGALPTRHERRTTMATTSVTRPVTSSRGLICYGTAPPATWCSNASPSEYRERRPKLWQLKTVPRLAGSSCQMLGDYGRCVASGREARVVTGAGSFHPQRTKGPSVNDASAARSESGHGRIQSAKKQSVTVVRGRRRLFYGKSCSKYERMNDGRHRCTWSISSCGSYVAD